MSWGRGPDSRFTHLMYRRVINELMDLLRPVSKLCLLEPGAHLLRLEGEGLGREVEEGVPVREEVRSRRRSEVGRFEAGWSKVEK